MPDPRLDAPTLALPTPSATWQEGQPPIPTGPQTDLRPMPMAGPGVFGSGDGALAADATVRVTVLPRAALTGPVPPLPRFSLAESLGRGGMGEVEAAQDNDIGRLVAIKRRRPGLEDSDGLARFADEIRTVGRLEHPNIVPIHDVGIDELGRHYLDGIEDPLEIMKAVREQEPVLFFLPKHPAQPRVPMDLLWYIKAGLAKDPAQRFPSVRAMLDRLDARADGRIPIQCPVTFTQRIGREIARLAAWNPTVTLAAWALTAVGLATSLVWMVAQ